MYSPDQRGPSLNLLSELSLNTHTLSLSPSLTHTSFVSTGKVPSSATLTKATGATAFDSGAIPQLIKEHETPQELVTDEARP